MKILLRYEEPDDEDIHLTLRLTLPKKYVDGPTKNVCDLFVKQYNNKHGTENPLEPDKFHLKLAGGDHLYRDSVVKDHVSEGDELYVMSSFDNPPAAKKNASPPVSKPATKSTPQSAPQATETAKSSGYSSSKPSPTESAKPSASSSVKVREDGKVRCKRFGCNRWFDPKDDQVPCRYHVAPPIFHETAKWWSCCNDKKAYDWESFMKIPGCQEGFCSVDPPEQRGQKTVLGGCDLRGQSAPERLDGPPNPQTSFNQLARGLKAMGVEVDLLDKALGTLAGKISNQRGEPDLEAVRDKMKEEMESALLGLVS